MVRVTKKAKNVVSKPTRQERADTTKKLTLEKCKELFKTHDFDSLTVRELASKCEISIGSFYNYFNSKEDLLMQIEREPYIDLYNEILLKTEDTTAHKLQYYLEKYFSILEESYGISMARNWLRHVASSSFAETYGKGNTKSEFDVKMISDIINEGIHSGELSKDTPVETLARTFVSNLYGTIVFWCMTDGDFDLNSWGAKFFSEIMDKCLDSYKN